MTSAASGCKTPDKIYALECKQYKWYIGRTSKPLEERFKEHQQGSAEWTKEYPPLKCHFVRDATSKFDEDYVALEYMERYGVENVRGGVYSSVVLSEEIKAVIQRQLKSANDQCLKCGKHGHFAKDCTLPIKKLSYERPKCKLTALPPPPSRTFHAVRATAAAIAPKPIRCYRCGRNTHISPNCRANTHLNGTPLS